MKNKMKNLSLIFVAVWLLGSCSSATTSEEKSTEDRPALAEESNQNNPMLDFYIVLKDAMVSADAEAARKAASELSGVLKDDGLKTISASIAELEDIKDQRVAFKALTDGLIDAFRSNDVTENAFIQYCPMAFDNTGASWISLSEEIRNPYFGDMMLKCGRVEEKL